MNRQVRRKIQQDRQKSLSEKTFSNPLTNRERILTIATGLTIIFLFLYLALRDNSISNDDLSTIYVTLNDTPKYDSYRVKSTEHKDIILKTKEYSGEFKITQTEYLATNHSDFKATVFSGDKIELKVKKTDLDNLNDNTFWNPYISVYGLTKSGKSYVDLDLRSEIIDKDSKWFYLGIVFGLVILPYGFINGKPQISMKKTLMVTTILFTIIMLMAH